MFQPPQFDTPQTTRFAPSPTGELHLGHAYAAIIAHDIARQSGGKFLLRIDDIDTTRCRPHFIDQIYEDLSWLQLSWDDTPLIQTSRTEAYASALDQLTARRVTYPCFCTRKEIQQELKNLPNAPHGPEGPLYPGTCRTLSPENRRQKIEAGQAFAVRLNAAKLDMRTATFFEHGLYETQKTLALEPALFGDLILSRKDVGTSYHLATVLDDHHQGITLVTRGEDLFPASHIQRALQELLGMSVPEYCHHPLIHREDGKRLAKRDKDQTLRALRLQGVGPEEIRNRLNLSTALG